MKKNSLEELKFPTLKIKRIIQENKEIGKIANMSPYVICKKTFWNFFFFIPLQSLMYNLSVFRNTINFYFNYFYSKIIRISINRYH